MSTLKITGVGDDMGNDLVLDGEDGEIGASCSLEDVFWSSAKASHWGGNATCNIPCFSADLRSLNCNKKLRHVFLSIGNSPQTAELNTALRSPLYTPGHGPIFHLDEPGWPDQEGRLDLWWIVDRNVGCLTCSISSWSELLSLTSCDMQHNLNWNKLVGEHTTNSRSW